MEAAKESAMVTRLAQWDDIPGILAIGDVYGGTDYLAYYLPTYLRDPDYYCYVAELDGKVVGFRFLCLIDEGSRLESGAARVLPSYRSKGVDFVLLAFTLTHIGQEHPMAAQNIVYTAIKNPFYIQLVTGEPESHQLLFTGNMLSLNASMEAVTEVLSFLSEHRNLVHYPTEEEFVSKMMSLSQLQRKCLFPDELMVVFWKPLRLMPGNLHNVYKLGTVFWTKEGSECCPLLSCAQVVPCQAGLKLNHTIFGTAKSCLKSHIWQAFLYFHKWMPSYQGNIEYFLFYPHDMTVTAQDLFGEKINWKPGVSYDKKQYLAIKYVPKPGKL